jgi:hypothetical protein
MEAQNEQGKERMLMIFVPPRILVGIDGGPTNMEGLIVLESGATHRLVKRAADLVPMVNQRTGEMQINGLLLGDVIFPIGSFAVCELVADSAYRKAYYAIAANIHLA